MTQGRFLVAIVIIESAAMGPGRDLCPYRCHQFPGPHGNVADPSIANADANANAAAVEQDRQEIEELFQLMRSVASSPNHGGGGEVIELNPFGRIQILYSLSDRYFC